MDIPNYEPYAIWVPKEQLQITPYVIYNQTTHNTSDIKSTLK